MKRLTDEEFNATIAQPMVRISTTEAPFDFWPYVTALPVTELDSYDFSEAQVSCAYRHPAGTWLHVQVTSNDKNVFLILVLNVDTKEVLGHRLMNLNAQYGAKE